MKLVILSLLFVVSFAHGAAAPPADDADALRRRINTLEDDKIVWEMEKATLTAERDSLKALALEHGKNLLIAEKRLLALHEQMEVMRKRLIAMREDELGKLPKPPPDADKDKAATAEVVVRGIPKVEFMVRGLETDPPPVEWTYSLVVTHVFKAPPKKESLLGKKIIVKANRALEGPITLYLVFEEEKDFRLVYWLQDFSHAGP